MDETIYNFTLQGDGYVDVASIEVNCGTLAEAIELAKDHGVVVRLYDDRGWPRGRVERDGDYRLS